MIEKEINEITEVIATLPKKTKKNKEKYNEYIEENLKKYRELLVKCQENMALRYQKIIKQNDVGNAIPELPKINFRDIKYLEKECDSVEKMNLNLYFYELKHYNNDDLDRCNEIILNLINEFKNVGINLNENDFVYSEYASNYIKKLLTDINNTHVLFDQIYWECPNLITHIELNFRYLYLKHKKVIDKYFEKTYQGKTISEYLKNFFELKNYIKVQKHYSNKYIFSLFTNKKLNTTEVSEKTITPLLEKVLLDVKQVDNYENLLKLQDSLNEFKNYQEFAYLINEFKTLFEKKSEYKGLYSGKLKEIIKKESKLFKITKTINKESIFKKNNTKNNQLKLDRNSLIEELNVLYKELDDLKIKDIIFNKVTNNTNYYDILKIATFDFNFFASAFQTVKDGATLEDIKKELEDLYYFIYTEQISIINNVSNCFCKLFTKSTIKVIVDTVEILQHI